MDTISNSNMNIHPNKVLESLRKGRISLGGWIFSGSPVIAEIMAMSGFEWVCIDAEHTQVSKETAMSMINVMAERRGSFFFISACTIKHGAVGKEANRTQPVGSQRFRPHTCQPLDHHRRRMSVPVPLASRNNGIAGRNGI